MGMSTMPHFMNRSYVSKKLSLYIICLCVVRLIFLFIKDLYLSNNAVLQTQNCHVANKKKTPKIYL